MVDIAEIFIKAIIVCFMFYYGIAWTCRLCVFIVKVISKG